MKTVKFYVTIVYGNAEAIMTQRFVRKSVVPYGPQEFETYNEAEKWILENGHEQIKYQIQKIYV